jgi:hypothetical protein
MRQMLENLHRHLENTLNNRQLSRYSYRTIVGIWTRMVGHIGHIPEFNMEPRWKSRIFQVQAPLFGIPGMTKNATLINFTLW